MNTVRDLIKQIDEVAIKDKNNKVIAISFDGESKAAITMHGTGMDIMQMLTGLVDVASERLGCKPEYLLDLIHNALEFENEDNIDALF